MCMTLTQPQKQALADLAASGIEIGYVAYYSNTVTGTPEADALADGWTQNRRQVSGNLIEVIYTK